MSRNVRWGFGLGLVGYAIGTVGWLLFRDVLLTSCFILVAAPLASVVYRRVVPL